MSSNVISFEDIKRIPIPDSIMELGIALGRLIRMRNRLNKLKKNKVYVADIESRLCDTLSIFEQDITKLIEEIEMRKN